jgi:hypothetical protein
MIIGWAIMVSRCDTERETGDKQGRQEASEGCCLLTNIFFASPHLFMIFPYIKSQKCTE